MLDIKSISLSQNSYSLKDPNFGIIERIRQQTIQIYIITNFLRMQLNELFAKVLSNPKQFTIQSKQDFFQLKSKQKRMKKSTCFSELIEKDHIPIDINSSLTSVLTQGHSLADKKELQSTFGEEGILSFKTRPPKKKRNTKANLHLQKRIESQSQQDSDQSLKNSYIFAGTKPEPTKSSMLCLKKTQRPFANILKISNFHIMSKIGQGTYSEVYQAIQKQTGFICALKILEKQKMRQMGVEQNIIRQIKINLFLDHPNIAKLYGCFHDSNYIYLICEYATDRSLYQIIKQPCYKRKKELSYDKLIKIICQICESIKHLHSLSIIHRDIKPENILLTMNSTIKICDFGWSVYNPNKQMRLTMCGTPLYLAPEMINQSQYDQSIDVWAIGVMTYELLTEEAPFKITQLKDLRKIVHQQINLDAISNRQASDFIKCAMQKDPNKRKSIFQLCRHPFISYFFHYNSRQ